MKRAEFAKQYLVSKGVAESSLSVVGAGSENPISMNLNEQGDYFWRSLKYNRRVEFKILNQGRENQLIVKQVVVPEEYRIMESIDLKYRYSIWLMTYKEPISIDDFGLSEVSEYRNSDGTYDYYYGIFDSLNEAEASLSEIQRRYPNSFVGTLPYLPAGKNREYQPVFSHYSPIPAR